MENQKTAEYWNKRGETYSEEYYRERYFGLGCEEREDYTRILEFLNLQEVDRVLEIGCGLGGLLKRLPSEHKMGVDVSSFAVGHCCKQGLSVIRADVEEGLPFEDNTFDVVAMTAVIEHFKNPDLVLRECFRVLAPRGRIVITSPVRSWFVHDLDPTHFSEMTVVEMRTLVQKCGFKIAAHEVRGFSFLYLLLENFLYRPGRFAKKLLEGSRWGSEPIELARLAVDRSSSWFLNRWRRNLLWLGQSQLVLAQK